ncbi:MAG: hypothetical protein WBZ31_10455 [Thiobacillus sp.]
MTTHSQYAAHTPEIQSPRLPAYGRDLVVARQAGYIVPFLILSLGWNFGRAMPRLVIPDDMHLDELDLHVVAGIGCMVVHHDQSVRAFDVAELALLAGATSCPVFNMAMRGLEATTSEVMIARGMKVAA